MEDRRLLSSYFVNMTGQTFEDVPGYMTDIGAPYGDRADRGNAGTSYGWVNSTTGAPADNTANARNRNNANVPPAPGTPINELYDSFNHLQKQTPPFSWEIAIPNGFYNVHMASGDPTATDSRFQMRVEGVQIYDASPAAPNYWVEGSVAVNVTDGKLTVSTGPNASNAKLNFVEITSVDTAPDQAPVLSITPSSGKVTLNWASVPKTASYNLLRGTSAGTETLYQSGLTGTTYTDNAVTVGTTYFYRLVPVNPVGSGPQSNEVSTRVTATYAHVNFQPNTTANPTPAGYLKDSGDPFGDRGNGFSYGWWNAADNVTPLPTANSSTRERINGVSPDQRYDTLLQLHKAGESPATGPVWWQINVPNGTYQVRVVAGDPANADEYLSFIAEANKDANGVPLVDGSGVSLIHYDANGQTGIARFADSGFMEVTVTDGNLTISEGPDAANNKICFIDIDTLTVASKPTNPTGLTITNARASQLTLNWNDASTDETGFRIEQSTDGNTFTPLTTAPSHTGTGPVSFVVPGLTPSTHYYYRVYAVNLQGDSVSPTNIADTTTTVTTGGLSGRVNATTGDVNLSAEGTLDWAHWGSVAANTFDHKSGVTSRISDAAPVGASSKVQLTNSPTTFSWTDGTVSSSMGTTANTLGTFAWGHGFTFTVPADTTVRALRVYVGVNNLRGQILARLSDGSAPDYVDSSITSATLADGVYTLIYSAASAGQTLSVTWIELPNNGDQVAGRLSLKAATLQLPPAIVGTAATVAAKPLTSGRVLVTWTDAATNDFGYYVERAPNVAGAPGAYTRIGQVADGVTSFLDTGTIGVANTSYFYRLVPYNIALTAGTPSAAVALTTVAGPFGDGALATYYDAPDLGGGNDPTLGTAWPTTSIDPTINFDFAGNAPAGAGAGFGADTFLIRWSAKIKPEFTGDYVFTAEADDGYRLWVNGTLVLDNLSRRGGLGTFFDGTPITLIAGKTYDIVYDVADNTGNAAARLYWSTAGLPREIVPQAVLFHADQDQTVAPTVTGVAVDDRLPPTALPDVRQQIAVRFSENVGNSVDVFDFTIQSLAPGGPTYDSTNFSVTWDAPSNSAILYFGGLPNNLLPDGNYRLTVGAASLSDNFFNTLDGDNNNAPGGDYVADFFVLTGDVNHDRSVNFTDLVALAQNYNGTGKSYADGDFNHDGVVNFNDLVLLAQRYNTTLAPPPAPAPVAAVLQPVAVAPTPVTTSPPATTTARPAARPAGKPAAAPPPAPPAPPTPPPAPQSTFATRKISTTREFLAS